MLLFSVSFLEKRYSRKFWAISIRLAGVIPSQKNWSEFMMQKNIQRRNNMKKKNIFLAGYLEESVSS